MERKGFTSLDSVRGKLAAPADTTGSAYQRAGYLTTLRAANQGARAVVARPRLAGLA